MAAWSIIHTLGDAEQRRAAAFLRTRWYDNAAAATEATIRWRMIRAPSMATAR
jgi:hypothetical protein